MLFLLGVFNAAIEDGSSRGKPDTGTLDSFQAQSYSESAVKAYLKSPRSAKFSDFKFAYLGHERWLVTGYVDSQNGFGAMIRKQFALAFQYSPDRDWFRCLEVDGNQYGTVPDWTASFGPAPDDTPVEPSPETESAMPPPIASQSSDALVDRTQTDDVFQMLAVSSLDTYFIDHIMSVSELVTKQVSDTRWNVTGKGDGEPFTVKIYFPEGESPTVVSIAFRQKLLRF